MLFVMISCHRKLIRCSFRDAGFDLVHKPTNKFPNHFRLIQPDGAAGFTPENLARLSKAFEKGK
jgi:hypothetical protein